MGATRTLLAALAVALFAARPAGATFHFMQIEQVIGGVDGTDIQAIQLRQRFANENLVSNAWLRAWDASGANPVLLISFPTNVAHANAGDRILVATSNFASDMSPPLTPDFILTDRIPASYLAAGSITFERKSDGLIYWRLSWGASYTGSGSGELTNDADGNFSPSFSGPLPSSTEQALQFKFAASALSTTNANDYAATSGAATFTRNDGASGVVLVSTGVGEGAPGALAIEPPTPNPAHGRIACSVVLPKGGRARVRLLDVSGRALRTLLDGPLPAGRSHLTWDVAQGGRLASGLYFLDLETAGTHTTRRWVLIR